MNQQSTAYRSSSSRLRHILFVLLGVAFLAILLSCKPAASPVTLSLALSTPTLSSTENAIRQGLVVKATQLAQVDQTETAARLTPHPKVLGPTPMLGTPKPKPTAFPPLVESDMTPAGAGVIAQTLVLLNKGRYAIENDWIENRSNNTERVFVYAGELIRPDGSDTTQGVVIVQVAQISLKNGQAVIDDLGNTEYLTPIQAGAVKIIGAVGERLILQSVTNGTTFYFDVPSRQFVASLTSVVPRLPTSPLATPAP